MIPIYLKMKKDGQAYISRTIRDSLDIKEGDIIIADVRLMIDGKSTFAGKLTDKDIKKILAH